VLKNDVREDIQKGWVPFTKVRDLFLSLKIWISANIDKSMHNLEIAALHGAKLERANLAQSAIRVVINIKAVIH